MLADCHARAVFQISDYTKTTGVIDHAEGRRAHGPGNSLESTSGTHSK